MEININYLNELLEREVDYGISYRDIIEKIQHMEELIYNVRSAKIEDIQEIFNRYYETAEDNKTDIELLDEKLDRDFEESRGN